MENKGNKRYRIWASAAAVTVVTVGAAFYVDALETGHSEGGLKAEPVAAAKTCVGTRPAPTGSGTASAADNPDNPDDTPLFRTLFYIQKAGDKQHSAVFTGLSVDQHDNAADVYRIPSTAFDADVCAAAEKGVTLRLHDTDANRKDLDGLADRISEDMHRWDGTFQLREVGVDERGYVHVGVDDPDKAEPVIEAEFGGRHIKVRHVEQAQDDAGT